MPTQPLVEPDAGRCVGLRCVADAGSPTPPAADGGEPDAGTDAGCVPTSLSRQRLDLLVVLDDSATLDSSWTQLRVELDQFLAEDASRGMAVGLQLFGQSCGVSRYVTPIVPILPLPDNLSALTSAVPDTVSANTSTIPALTGEPVLTCVPHLPRAID